MHARVTSLVAHPIDQRGHLLGGRDGVHIHHMYVNDGQNILFQQYSCMTCPSESGGERCLLLALPPGMGMPVYGPLRILPGLTLFQNITTPIRILFALRLSSTVHQLVVHSKARSPDCIDACADSLMEQFPAMDMPSLISLSRRTPWPWGKFGSGYPIPRKLIAFWHTSQFTFAGRVVWVHAHVHRVAEEKVYIWGAPPEKIGLNVGAMHLKFVAHAWQPLPLHNISEIEQKLVTPTGVPRCMSTSKGVEAFPHYTADRDDGLQCDRPWSFREQDFRTILCVHRTPSSSPSPVMGGHCHLLMILSPDDASLVVNDQVIGVPNLQDAPVQSYKWGQSQPVLA